MTDLLSTIPIVQLGVITVLLMSVLVLWRLDRTHDWGPKRRSRLLMGVPWGTTISILGVLGVYLFIQGGYEFWGSPVTVAFRSWSYLYPLGMITAPFAHNGPNHLTGNLIATIVLGSLAEYVWGHFPSRRGSTAFSGWRTNPYVRAFILFPTGVVLIGLLTSLFSWGPVIGFSGVVFAFAGFSLVRHPLLTIVALEARDIVRLVFRAVRDPVVLARTEPQLVEPWWAGIAVQGHLLGLFIGIIIGAWVLRYRSELNSTRLWIGTLLIGSSLSLWAVWWFRGGEEFVLFRGIGLVLIVVLALLVTLGIKATNTDHLTAFGVPLRQVGLLALVFPVLIVGFVAVPLNLNTVADTTAPGDAPGTQIRDYSVTYAENVTNQQTSVINLSGFGETTQVKSSGVIIVSGDRQLWTQHVSTTRLKFAGRANVRLGGVTWRETVRFQRIGWTVTQNGTTYQIWIKPPREEWRVLYLSESVIAEPVLDGKRVSIQPTSDGFVIEVSRNGSTIDRNPLPEPNSIVGVGGLWFIRENNTIFASFNQTEVRVAKKETYPGQRN